MITRRILVTEVVNADSGGTRFIYGRFDAVSLAAKNEKIVHSEFRMYKMKEEDFVKHGKEIEK